MSRQKGIKVNLGSYQPAVDQRLDLWKKSDWLKRLWERDAFLWPPDLSSEIGDRLGWLDLPGKMQEKWAGFKDFADSIKGEGVRHVVLLGMGGSSLAPEVFKKIWGNSLDSPELLVLDSTHPIEVAGIADTIDFSRSLFLVSSKSGTTLETLSLFRYFWGESVRRGQNPGRNFMAITDKSSPLEFLAQERGFRRTFFSPSDVGGRFSALSEFGLVPAALMGLDIKEILEQAMIAAQENGPEVSAERASGLLLGAVLGEVSQERDKLTFIASRSFRDFPSWIEQLVAESLGKSGKGIIPVVDEPPGSFELYGKDRFFVLISLEKEKDERLESWETELRKRSHPYISLYPTTKYGLGGEFFRWEIAVAASAAMMKICPFDQPDVQLTKELTHSAMRVQEDDMNRFHKGKESLTLDDQDHWMEAVKAWLRDAKEGDYVALQAFVPRRTEIIEELQNLRYEFLKRTRLATTMGIGPRFLHSTGQLHKGGPEKGLFLQLVDDPELDLPIPETEYSFAELIRAQALGDYQALLQRRRNVIRINLRTDILDGLAHIKESLHKI